MFIIIPSNIVYNLPTKYHDSPSVVLFHLCAKRWMLFLRSFDTITSADTSYDLEYHSFARTNIECYNGESS
nr:MAG TPA: hypothetical protein [Caudoviricetes sp.]